MTRKKKLAASTGPALPSVEDILAFIEDSPGKVGKREIARAFHIKGGQRIALKRMLKEMAAEGLIEGQRKSYNKPGQLAKVSLIDIDGRDDNGDFFGLPTKWDEAESGPRPKVLIGEGRSKSRKLPGIGDRVLAHIDATSIDETGYSYIARPIKVLPRDNKRLLGIYRRHDKGGDIHPIDKKALKNWSVREEDSGKASDGELVSFEILSRGRFSVPRARILDRLGHPDQEKLISLIAIETHGIPHHFHQDTLSELKTLPPIDPPSRTDLRALPLITIDPFDARDHDDAVYAVADRAEDNQGGWIITVAIADVAHYVRPKSALDREAFKRGNSVYFPDRVVPMLPEIISNDLCSLREGEDRPALCVEMVFDKAGKKRRHSFKRALICSHAKLSYEQAQAAIDGRVDDKTAPLLEPVLAPLFAAYDCLRKAREKRAPLALDLPERKITMNDSGKIERIHVPERLEAHKLIEEFMIQANVAAAETLEKKNMPLLYRVHDCPSEEKLAALKDFLATLDMKLGGSGPLSPALFNGILSKVEGKPYQQMVMEVVLRSQAQAEYSPANLGHFGLNLSRYAHFTSPIRRYADLIIHRGLIACLGLGAGGLSDDEGERLDEIGAQVSMAERRAMIAERETIDRLVALYLEHHHGAEFNGRISGVTRSGLFVRLEETGADGFIPISTLGDDYYHHDDVSHMLVGERSRRAYQIGQAVTVKLVEIVPMAGALRFEMMSEGLPGGKLSRRAGEAKGRRRSASRRFKDKAKRGKKIKRS